jgi:hypothetical protein
VVDEELLVEESLRRGMAASSWRLRQLAIGLLLEREVFDRVSPDSITREELESAFARWRQRLARPAMARYGMLRVIDAPRELTIDLHPAGFDDRARAAARQLSRTWYFAPAGWESLRRVSDLLGSPVAQALGSMRPGTVRGPVDVGRTRYWLHLEAYRPAGLPTLAEAEPILRSRLADARRARLQRELVERLRAAARVERATPAGGSR